jgi:hypothetical protein
MKKAQVSLILILLLCGIIPPAAADSGEGILANISNASLAVPPTGTAVLGSKESMGEYQAWLNQCAWNITDYSNILLKIFGFNPTNWGDTIPAGPSTGTAATRAAQTAPSSGASQHYDPFSLEVTTSPTPVPITVTSTPTTITTTVQARWSTGDRMVVHPGQREVSVTVDRRKNQQIFLYYSGCSDPTLRVISFKVEMLNVFGQYSSQIIDSPFRYRDLYLSSLNPSGGKDSLEVTATFNDGEVQTVLMTQV